MHVRGRAVALAILSAGVSLAAVEGTAVGQSSNGFSGACPSLDGPVAFGPHFSFVPSPTSLSITLDGACTGTFDGVTLTDQHSSLNINANGTMGCGGSASVGADGNLTIYAGGSLAHNVYLPFRGSFKFESPNFVYKVSGTVGGSASGDGSLLGPGTNIVAMSPAVAGCVAGGAKKSESSGRLFASGLQAESSAGSPSPSAPTHPTAPKKPRKHTKAKKHKRR
jgi:hypothetical protein